jgi:hypothetical protein
MTTYEYVPGSRVPVSAQVAGETLDDIAEQNGGRLVPRQVWRTAAPDNHPLHRCFEWNDAKCGLLYRDEQARRLIRSVVVCQVGDVDAPEPVRAFVNMQTPDGETPYMRIAAVLSDEELATQLLARALAEARAWQRRYRHLEQLHEVFAAIDRLALV